MVATYRNDKQEGKGAAFPLLDSRRFQHAVRNRSLCHARYHDGAICWALRGPYGSVCHFDNGRACLSEDLDLVIARTLSSRAQAVFVRLRRRILPQPRASLRGSWALRCSRTSNAGRDHWTLGSRYVLRPSVLDIRAIPRVISC